MTVRSHKRYVSAVNQPVPTGVVLGTPVGLGDLLRLVRGQAQFERVLAEEVINVVRTILGRRK